MDTDLDRIIRDSFVEFVAWLFAPESTVDLDSRDDNTAARRRWFGREREAISLYAVDFLRRRCQTGSVLSDARQIGIEVVVPGVPGLNRKRPCRVNKDLVIWPAPAMTT